MKKDELRSRLEAAIEISQIVGKFIMSGTIPSELISFKKDETDPVTWFDEEAQRRIIDYLKKRFPSDEFYAEESGVRTKEIDNVWVIDPIDGTVNYIAEIPFYCVSIAFMKEGRPVIGVVHHPPVNETFYACKGEGAFLNGRRIHVSRISNPRESVLTVSHESGETHKLMKVLESKIRRIRMYGTAALQGAYVAAGRTQAYLTFKANVWDVAAVQVLVEEAGGMSTDWEGNNLDWPEGRLLFSNGLLHETILNWIEEAGLKRR
ncbi:MAG: monophosphatase [Thermotogota bacterium]|nr:monophosphatase [Thermotogota bacterium]MDK2864052.1 monophosphatase [Thermotogota bacterium]HCZ06307.1 inositol monophosphatase [Thermotogota bacterium]